MYRTKKEKRVSLRKRGKPIVTLAETNQKQFYYSIVPLTQINQIFKTSVSLIIKHKQIVNIYFTMGHYAFLREQAACKAKPKLCPPLTTRQP